MDFTVSSKFGEDGEIKEGVTLEEGVPDGFMGLDCGPLSNEKNKAAIMESKTIIWNGPMGVFEMDKFAVGTKSMMDAVVAATEAGTVTVIGGGDTATACKKYDGGQGHALLYWGRRLFGAPRGQGAARNR